MDYATKKRVDKVERLLGVISAIAVRTGTPLVEVQREWKRIAEFARLDSPECWAALHTLEGVARIKEGQGLHAGTSLELFIDILDGEIEDALDDANIDPVPV